ncbi:MAG: Smr/MutS family protein [Alphaproteobacteria bacterium]|nr:Smr/MutS family protein [Alphaproteobacteria bacterium]
MKRKLTPEDLHLWKNYVKDVEVLVKAKSETQASVMSSEKKLKPIVRRRLSESIPPRQSLNRASETSVPPPPSLGRKEFRRVKVAGRLDLHGLTLEKAHQTLGRFLLRAQEQGFKTVLVITGKGSLTLENTLRCQLPRWLEETPLRELVTSIHYPAKPQDGGQGAFYVGLRRSIKS